MAKINEAKNHNLAILGGSYSAAFFKAKDKLQKGIDFYCGVGSSISKTLDIDSNQSFRFNPTHLEEDKIEWLREIYKKSTEFNECKSPAEYKSFIIYTQLKVDPHRLFLSEPKESLQTAFSNELVRKIMMSHEATNNEYLEQLHQVKQLTKKLSNWNTDASVYVFPTPLEIEDINESNEKTLLSSNQFEDILFKKIEGFYASEHSLNMKMPPLETITNNLKTRKQFCTLTNDRNWRLAIKGDVLEHHDQYTRARNRHRNKEYAVAHKTLIEEILQA